MPGGCVFVQAAVELDDRPGPARDLLVRQQKEWLGVVATVVSTAVAEGHFRPDVDADQLAFELHGLMLAWHHGARLLRDARSGARARAAFEALIARARR
jgi:hypothetical protein